MTLVILQLERGGAIAVNPARVEIATPAGACTVIHSADGRWWTVQGEFAPVVAALNDGLNQLNPPTREAT
jgi:hypothetical protein